MIGIRAALRHDLVVSCRRVLSGSLVAVLANGVTGVISARALAVADKGLLAMILTIGPLLWVVTSLGSNVALRVELPRGDGGVGMSGYRRLTAGLAVLQAGLTAVLVAAAAWMPGVAVTWSLLLLILVLSVATFISSQWLEALHALGHSAEATRTDAFGAVATLVLMSALIALGPRRSLMIMLCCYLAGYGLRIGYSALRIHQLTASDGSRRGTRRLLRRGVSFLGFNVGQVVAFRADRYLLGPLASPTAVGLYSVAATPAEMLRLPVTALSQIMMQRSASTHVSRRALKHACFVTAAITIPPAVTLFVLADVVITILFGARYADAGGVLRIMVCSEVLVSFFILLSRIALGAGLARATGLSTALGAATGMVALVWWAPQFGASGAAHASLAAYAVMLATCLPPVLRHTSRNAQNPLGGQEISKDDQGAGSDLAAQRSDGSHAS